MSRQAEEHNAVEKHRNALRASGSSNPVASLRKRLMPDASDNRSAEDRTRARETSSDILLSLFCKTGKPTAGQDMRLKSTDLWLILGGQRSPSGFVPSGTYLGHMAVGGLFLAPGSEKRTDSLEAAV